MTAIALFAFHDIGTTNKDDWNKLVWERHIVPVHFSSHLLTLLGGTVVT